MRTKLLYILVAIFCTAVQAQQYVPALPGYHYEFPRDHFSHPEYGTEWWYYTGNLRGKDGHRFGFELTFFRQGISQTKSGDPWHVNDIYMAHLALSDLSGGRYYTAERLNRAGPGIAGIDAASGTVWNGNWQTVLGRDAHHLRGVGENFSLDLSAAPLKGPVIHGTDGVSQKAEGAGHASHYISFTRMKSTGTVELNGSRYQIDGDTWMDHEFFSESMNGDEVGWDWLSIQLNDNTELMLYRLRHKDGSVDPYSSGTYVDNHGRATHLTLRDFTMISPGIAYHSQKTGATYPVAWSVTIPMLKLQLSINTPLSDQEFVSHFGPSYWEGAIDVSGQEGNQSVHGTGYLEMTGYSDPKGALFGTTPR
ncbi:MAG TPA: lipocalin-like domain-containing protein [Acidobacteriaceae bacterium]|nr:lipocalin-like domain-containing protein [Acidobacteriaceae bacterium]